MKHTTRAIRALSFKQRSFAAALLLALSNCQIAVAVEGFEHSGTLQGGGFDGGTGEKAAHSLQHFNDHHRELCTWQSSYQEPSSYHYAVEKIGYPTEYELLVSKNQYIEDVSCPVCGAEHQTVGFVGKNLREEGKCPICSSFNRLRQIAVALLPEAHRIAGRPFSSLKELALSELTVYNTQCAGPLHTVLSGMPGYVCSEYISSEVAPGTIVRTTRHEDLQHTSFSNATFDLIISSEVLDHVPRPYQAHQELRRILKPGGSHVFTVPFSPTDLHDQVRASVEEGRLVHHIGPPIYAGDPLHQKGALLFTIFGQEMVDNICMLGYVNVTTHHLHIGAHGILGNNAWVFVATTGATQMQMLS